jgi:GNAT superfamily N-acetyltransferase
VIRPATARDAEAIAGVQVRAWHHAYADIVAPEHLAEHTVASRTARWRELLARGESTTLVIEVQGAIAGFATIVPGELRALYVDPPAQGAGAGSALLRAAHDALRADGRREAVLWVFEANGHARAFYERHGWAAEDPPVVNDDRWARELRYHKTLAP